MTQTELTEMQAEWTIFFSRKHDADPAGHAELVVNAYKRGLLEGQNLRRRQAQNVRFEAVAA